MYRKKTLKDNSIVNNFKLTCILHFTTVGECRKQATCLYSFKIGTKIT